MLSDSPYAKPRLLTITGNGLPVAEPAQRVARRAKRRMARSGNRLLTDVD
jgi:hypothetical protein